MGTGNKNYQSPDWFTAAFLQDVLKEYFKDETLEVRDLIVKSAFGNDKPRGFASKMHRAIFNLVRKDVSGKFSVILKEHPKGRTGVAVKKNKLFQREILAYKDILPRMESLLAALGEKSKIAPACYYTSETPEPYLILEDMELTGYENFEKGRLLNLDFALPAVEKLAKLHAASAVIAAENPDIIKFFESSLITHDNEHQSQLDFIPVAIRSAAAESSRWEGYEEITKKLFKVADNVLDGLADIYLAQPNGFRVFNLADLWIDNLMFQINHDAKTAEDVVLLDFQLAYFGSPGLDLNYFLYGSVNENVRKVHLKFIVHTYQKVLKETLEKLNYKGEIPYLKTITIEMIKTSLQGVIAATCLTPIILSEIENIDDHNILYASKEDGERICRENIENIKYRLFLQRTVKDFELNGFLDI